MTYACTDDAVCTDDAMYNVCAMHLHVRSTARAAAQEGGQGLGIWEMQGLLSTTTQRQ